jgi:hypothetical protein
MNKRLLSILLALLSILTFTLLSSSDDVDRYRTYTPIFMQREAMENAVKAESAKALKNPGKIYVYDNYIFINEKYKGIHVIDNSDPGNPVNKAFIHIDGCLDVSVKGDIIYADNAVDLIALKVNSDFTSVQVTQRLEKVFPEVADPDGYWPYSELNSLRPKNSILVAWEKK